MSTHYYTLLKALFEVKTGEYVVKTRFLTKNSVVFIKTRTKDSS